MLQNRTMINIHRNGARVGRGFTLLEMLAVVTILGIMALVIVPRIGGHTLLAKKNVCRQYKADLDAAIEQYYFEKGSFPASVDELNPEFYPEAIPVCPVSNQPYSIDAATNRIAGHTHP